MKKAKLMADYQCWCLWDMDSPKNINPDALPISGALKERLHLWEDIFDKTIDLTSNIHVGIDDELEYNAFYDLGWNLLEALRSELPGIEWWYRDRRYSGILTERPKEV